ncbi:MAG: SelT/selW/selH selenoprotein [Rhodospirillaceae bacterium]|nr:SelT/selW/selH selenoprotein [Rhodospirillaceae bacterium]HAD87902.1 SelT/selW/selH selenoprotein [Rhodospirillaceae bacterium]|tara:strand:+ start:184 stop:480 length:297 start_codon:yes stop_codon:yes gene_type:complete
MSKPTVAIRYCTGCRWLLRAAWMAQELLTTFEDDLAEVSLVPDHVGGRFIVSVGETVVWDRKRDGGFPEIKVLKQRVRDIVAPDRDLGHSGRHSGAGG